MRDYLIALTRNPLSLAGTAITTASAVLIVTLFSIELLGFLGNPYIGILTYLILPGIFLVGLILIPLGIARERRRERRSRRAGTPAPAFPVIDLNREKTLRWVLVTLALTAANVVILAVATYKGVEVMESAEFCGTTCHSVMQPEYTAYRRSPHSRVQCVACHIGPGADWFVKSKLSGARQVASVAFDLHPRPIPTPVHDMRPARETCERCHSPASFTEDRLEVVTHYEEDEASSGLTTILLLRVGGRQTSGAHGIHWHSDPDTQIRYRSDPRREKIHEVELTLADGTIKTFRKSAPEAQAADPGIWRTMDCVDCHNRPAHVFRMPEEELDEALQQGRISRSLPYIRREGLRALRQEYASHELAREGIASTISAYYREQHPELAAGSAELVAQAGRTLAQIYETNVFPSMKVTWGSYPDFSGHRYDDGCFRCHDDEHVTPEGQAISQDCSLCHTLLAMDEPAPALLEQLQP